ncbi:MAG: TonB-dependent receptor, partial [Hydrogenovibrio sp.]|uniref:TonB-dependent receptor domain-containing protein n=1 Tax=Hydrogenovibrio sp. TaxID=2065821 RepID=UPI002870B1EA
SYGSFETTQQGFHGKKTIDHKGIQFMGAIDASAFHKQGDKKINAEGDQNSVDEKNLGANLGIKNGDLSLVLTLHNNQAETFYPGSLSLSEFEKDPSQDQDSNATEWESETTSKQLALKTLFSDNTKLEYHVSNTSTQAEFITYSNATNFETTQHSLDLRTKINDLVFQYGASTKETIYDDGNDITRDETSFYGLMTASISSQLSASAGYRTHHFQTDFSHLPKKQSDSLNAFNLGGNYLITPNTALYASFEQGYLLPNINRINVYDFGTSAYVYNDQIKPQETGTFLVGFKYKNKQTKLVAEMFYTRLQNEIFYNPSTSKNTNLDKTNKKGINLSAQGSLANLSGGINYQFTSTEIEEGGADGRYNGNVIPTAPEHTFKVHATYSFMSHLIPSLPRHSIRVSHKQNSSSYAASDFENKKGYMDGYQSTDVSYRLKNDKLTLQSGIRNLFEKSSGAFVYSSFSDKVVAYPTQYNRY